MNEGQEFSDDFDSIVWDDGTVETELPTKSRDMSPEIEKSFGKKILQFSKADLAEENVWLFQNCSELLLRRYGKRKDIKILELGPHLCTAIPEVLTGCYAEYLAIDYSESVITKLKEVLAAVEDKWVSTRAFARVGNTFSLDIPEKSQDLVVALHHDPIVGFWHEHTRAALAAIHKIMKDDAELVLCPWYFPDVEVPGILFYKEVGKTWVASQKEKDIANIKHPAYRHVFRRFKPPELLLENFEIVEKSPVGDLAQHIVVLKKK